MQVRARFSVDILESCLTANGRRKSSPERVRHAYHLHKIQRQQRSPGYREPSKVSVYSATKNILKQDSCPLGSSSWSYSEIYQAEVGKVFLLSVPVFILMF